MHFASIVCSPSAESTWRLSFVKCLRSRHHSCTPFIYLYFYFIIEFIPPFFSLLVSCSFTSLLIYTLNHSLTHLINLSSPPSITHSSIYSFNYSLTTSFLPSLSLIYLTGVKWLCGYSLNLQLKGWESNPASQLLLGKKGSSLFFPWLSYMVSAT